MQCCWSFRVPIVDVDIHRICREAADTLRLACRLAAPSACTYRDVQSVAALGLARVLRDREWAARCVRAIHTAEYALSDASGSRVVSGRMSQ